MASATPGAAADEPLGRVLICGAAGWLGRAITDAFITADFPVRLPRGGTCANLGVPRPGGRTAALAGSPLCLSIPVAERHFPLNLHQSPDESSYVPTAPD